MFKRESTCLTLHTDYKEQTRSRLICPGERHMKANTQGGRYKTKVSHV